MTAGRDLFIPAFKIPSPRNTPQADLTPFAEICIILGLHTSNNLILLRARRIIKEVNLPMILLIQETGSRWSDTKTKTFWRAANARRCGKMSTSSPLV